METTVGCLPEYRVWCMWGTGVWPLWNIQEFHKESWWSWFFSHVLVSSRLFVSFDRSKFGNWLGVQAVGWTGQWKVGELCQLPDVTASMGLSIWTWAALTTAQLFLVLTFRDQSCQIRNQIKTKTPNLALPQTSFLHAWYSIKLGIIFK